MPIYSKKHLEIKSLERKVRLDKGIDKEAKKKGNKIERSKKKYPYAITKTKFTEMYPTRRKLFLVDLDSLSKRNHKAKVLDWGCGTGNMVLQLSKKYPKMEFLGFSKDSYSEWHMNKNDNVKYLHTTAQVLERYLKKHKVDMIFSHFGLMHMFISSKDPEVIILHLKALKQGLNIGGKIIFLDSSVNNLQFENVFKKLTALKSIGFESQIIESNKMKELYSLTRVR